MPIGKDPDGIALFREQFEDVLKGEDWKIARIVNTTTNKMRNTAALNYMAQAEVAKFTIVGISDRLQCAYCQELKGREFEVTLALTQQNEITQSDPIAVGVVTPFITSSKLNVKPEDIAGMAAEELQAKGIGMPPFHGNCRCQIIANL